MNEIPEQDVTIENVEKATQEAVESADDIREQVRRITVTALTQRHLDTESIQRVIRAVVRGASVGATSREAPIGESLGQALKGLDEALAKSAEASKLAIEEALGRAGEFTQHELKQSFQDLISLEELYLDTLRDMAKTGTDRASEILYDLAEHGRNSGTVVGRYVIESLSGLNHRLQQAGKSGLLAGANVARTAGARVAAVASGILAGIAESLQPDSTKPKR